MMYKKLMLNVRHVQTNVEEAFFKNGSGVTIKIKNVVAIWIMERMKSDVFTIGVCLLDTNTSMENKVNKTPVTLKTNIATYSWLKSCS